MDDKAGGIDNINTNLSKAIADHLCLFVMDYSTALQHLDICVLESLQNRTIKVVRRKTLKSYCHRRVPDTIKSLSL